MDKKMGPESATIPLRAKARSLANLLLSEAGGDALRALGLLSLLHKDSQISITAPKERREAATHDQT